MCGSGQKDERPFHRFWRPSSQPRTLCRSFLCQKVSMLLTVINMVDSQSKEIRDPSLIYSEVLYGGTRQHQQELFTLRYDAPGNFFKFHSSSKSKCKKQTNTKTQCDDSNISWSKPTSLNILFVKKNPRSIMHLKSGVNEGVFASPTMLTPNLDKVGL